VDVYAGSVVKYLARPVRSNGFMGVEVESCLTAPGVEAE